MVRLFVKISCELSKARESTHGRKLSWIQAEREYVAHSMQAEGL